ncbi:MAG: PDDEXK nuclease domain-containing protein [Bacteroidales bacterium]|nr:PDDEXK nuclease domain-containing protein [Bacteroidales bacterium]MCM1147889.1 PDDEXK nuclease domain-containing protein [Bacteroidales bacterium]MCM1206732.1 PDDEXK nuclease domain-containing protein [Bacillota bacterium]MCM1510928.1 PDDEXK nuclease domain-containing protein [Clostridium sp.]
MKSTSKEINGNHDFQNIYEQTSTIVEQARSTAYRQINETLVRRNWLIGKLIAEEELKGEDRAIYGLQLIKWLSKLLTAQYGKGFTKTNLYSFTQFYKLFPEIFHSVSGKSPQLLSWTHYRTLLQELNPDARQWYEQEAAEQNWSVRTLQRNISSQYYHRLLAAQRKDLVEKEMLKLTAPLQTPDPIGFIKNPVIGEFLGFTADSSFRETELEQSIINNLEKFLLEMGKGFAFVARQQHIHTEKQDYYIDLVFYNYFLKSFVLIDLKTSKITHQDVGQMDMYVRMYDELKRTEGDNPTIGIVLCDDTDEDIARYSVLHDNDHLFAAKYMAYMPTTEQLRAEIERQKAIFYLQHKNKDEK